MIYNTLTINNITKVCDDNIYMDPSGNITDLQWFYFQLEFVFDKLGIPKYNSFTGLKYTMNQMYNILVKIYGSNVKVEGDKKTLIKYGFFSEKVKDTYTPKNLGGFINFQPELNDTKAFVKKPTKDDNYFKTAIEVDKTTPPKIVKKLKISVKSKSPEKISPKMSPKITDPRYQKSAIFIQNNKNTSCLNLGRITGEKTYSSLVSFLILIYYISLQDNNILYSRIFQWNPTDIELNNMGITNDNEIELIKEGIILFQEIGKKIQNKELYDINTFYSSVETLIEKFNKRYKLKNTNNFYNIIEYISKSLVIKSSQSNIQKLFLFSDNNKNLNINLKDFVFGYKIPLTDPLGKPFYEHIITQEYKSDIINHVIDSNKLLSLYNLVDLPEYPELDIISNKKDYIYDVELNKYLRKGRDAVMGKIKKNKFKVYLRNLLNSNSVQTPKNYYYLYSGYDKTEINGINYYYDINDKGDRSKWVPLENIKIEHGFKVKNIVNEETIYGGDANMIFVHLDRKFKRIKSGMIINGINTIKIVPDEVLDLQKGKYILNGIIVEIDNYYITIYKCDGKYWVYDLMYDTSLRDDYIQLIGDFNNILDYSYASINNVILSNAVSYLYKRME